MKHHIIIEIKAGFVQSVYSTDADDIVTINDLDTMCSADCAPVPTAMSKIYEEV